MTAFRKWSIAMILWSAGIVSAGEFAANSLPNGIRPVSGTGSIYAPLGDPAPSLTTLPGQTTGVLPAPVSVPSLTGGQPYLSHSQSSSIAGTPSPLANRNDCCGPIGGDGPINYEVYGLGGVNLILGSGAFADVLKTGWTVGAGARSLFFDVSGDAAWSVDLHGFYTQNEGTNPPPVVINGGNRASIFRLHRTAVGAGFGREWFTSLGYVGVPEGTLRGGIDVGYRLGTGHADFRPLGDPTGYTRLHSIFGQAYVGGHISVDVPMGDWTFTSGVRTEWNHTHWRSIYPGGSNLQGLMAGLFVGARF